jgi:GNAT superfamily N-acetyltransferase
MPQVIGNLSPEAVIEAIEGNLVDASTALGRTMDGVVFRGTDVTWVYTGFPSLSRVLLARFPQEDAEDRVAEILSYFKQWDAGVSWVVGPTSWPPKLGEYLHNQGFGSSEMWTGMAMNLVDLPPHSPPNAPGVRIETVDDDEGLRLWATLSPESAAAHEEAEGSLNVFAPQNAGSETHSRFYLAYVDGAPASRCMSFSRGGVVGLYWISTLPEHRGKGLGTAVGRRALEDARTLGSRVAVMPAPNRGLALCERLGFQAYCQFSVYAWPPAPIPMPS